MTAHPEFSTVVAEGAALQRQLGDLDLVAVGGTAVALHCRHRYSLDVNFDRCTTTPSPLRWLNVIERGGTDDWRDLYRRCRQRDFADQVAMLLQSSDPDSMPSARLWAFLLQDLHPDLVVTLPDPGRTGAPRSP